MKSSIYIFWIVFFLLILAAESKSQEQGNVSVRLKSGLMVIFSTKTEPTGTARQATGSIEVADENNIIHRAFVDGNRGTYFGYDLIVEPRNGKAKFKLTFQPLSVKPSKLARQVAARQVNLEPETASGVGGTVSSGGKSKIDQLIPLTNLGLSEYPESVFVQEGDTLALDVLVNPQTGVKIIDLIKVAIVKEPQLDSVSGSEGSINQTSMMSENQSPADFTVDAIELKMTASNLLINGRSSSLSEKDSLGYGVKGTLIWFYAPNHGRFILSLAPRDGYNFQKAGTIQGNKINFTFGGNQYDWISISPILPIGSRPWNLWVLYDPAYRPDVTLSQEIPFEVGAVERLEYLIKKQ